MTDSPSTASGADDLTTFVMGKLTRVLGAARAKPLFDETLASAKIARVSTADELYRFAQVLSARGGIEAAVGGLLSVAAVMRGASSAPKD